MYDHRSSDYFIHSDTFGIECHPCKSVVAEQRRHVAGMKRMRTIVGIIVRPGIHERIGSVAAAPASTVYMESQNRVAARSRAARQASYFGNDDRTVIRRIKCDRSMDVWMFIVPAQNCRRCGPALGYGPQKPS